MQALIEKIPQELKDTPQWVCWKAIPKGNGKVDKIPINPSNGRKAATDNPQTWGDFYEAFNHYQSHKDKGIHGIGFVFSKDDPYMGIDLDGVVKNGNIELQAQAYIDKIHSYGELSPSGGGVHLITKARIPGPRRRNGNVEMYQDGRFFTMTGDHLEDTPPTIEDRQKEVDTFYYGIFGREEEKPKPIETKPTLLSDSEVLEKATGAKNGQKFSKLMKGDYSDYPSQSEADLALCNELAFWCGNNPEQIDRLFRQSKLHRKKWDEKHGAKTYGEMTILKAIENTTETFTPGAGLSQEPVIRETDLGNAMRLVRLHGADIRYCHAWHKWLVWDSKRWELDAQGRIKKKAKDAIFEIYRGLDRCPDKDTRQRLFKHAIKSEGDQRIKAMLSLAESEAGIPVIPDELDKNPWLLNCENGTLDLRTGILNDHNKEDLITKICPVSYSEDAECPKWLKFLNTIMDQNQDLIDFIQRSIGYSLTGVTREQCLFFLFGTGANGKTTLLEAILALLNDYSRRADFSTFLVKYGESIRNDLARLKGARFVSAIETAEGKRLAEGLVKQLTGQDMVTARFLRQEFFEFQPEFKIWLAANHKPNIIGSDYAIWRRMKVIPFTVTIPEKLQNPDLANELKEELPGILRWGFEGCLAWQEVRLREPKEVKLATAKYKDDMDIIGDFLKDSCTISDESRVAKEDLYKSYSRWCEGSGEKKMSNKKFGMCLSDRGFEEYRDPNKRFWLEIQLKEP